MLKKGMWCTYGPYKLIDFMWAMDIRYVVYNDHIKKTEQKSQFINGQIAHSLSAINY